ncbi:hypothetical protein [Streptomyces eurythermus]|uniref:hypothetical protein n=1 Tax=Streptomyces eurythermus TaxID=42237 RepID=UPI0033D90E11
MLAERAPDSATADYLHEAFEPTARAIAGLERALEAVGLLDEPSHSTCGGPRTTSAASGAPRSGPRNSPAKTMGQPHECRGRLRQGRCRRSSPADPDKLAQVEKAIGQLRRERGRLTARAIAGRAGVSATFLYENTEARALVKSAVADSRSRHDRLGQEQHDRIESSWRERALNAEAELPAPRKRSSPNGSGSANSRASYATSTRWSLASPSSNCPPRTPPSNTAFQLTQEHRKLQERLEGARSNLRFAEKRIADLEAQLLERDAP